MNDKQHSKKKHQPAVVTMTVVNPDAAGIDVAAAMHVVAVGPDRDPNPVREFGAFTEDLYKIADWLQACKIATVAMESTGVYWRQLYLVLTERGFDVVLVNAKHVKNVTGRKTDQSDAQWIQKLHSCGLLQGSFLPDDGISILRTYVRHRSSLLKDSSKYVLRMQKAMELMNIKLAEVINDIMGKTGREIVEAIIRGERKPENFLRYVDRRIKADSATIMKSLTGNWRAEQVFLLQENFELYKYVQERIRRCDEEIEKSLQLLAAIANEGVIEAAPADNDLKKKKPTKKKKSKNHPEFNVRQYLKKIHGVDVIEIFGISESTALTILSETGTDLSKWEHEDKFVSWLNLCPNNKISGGKLISSKVLKRKPGLASEAFRMAANGLQRSDNWLGDYFRRMKSKGGNKFAIIATARKIAIIYYKMIKEKIEFMPVEVEAYRKLHNENKIKYLEKKLAKLREVA